MSFPFFPFLSKTSLKKPAANISKQNKMSSSESYPILALPAPPRTWTNRMRKQLRDKINKLSQTEHEEIFKILQTHNFTKNNNGVFFDISLLGDDVVAMIDNFVNFCINNKIELDEYDKHMNECKMKNCYDRSGGAGPVGTGAGSGGTKDSVPLTNAISSKTCADDWQGLIQESKTNVKIAAFVNQLESSSERLCIKRTNTKFINAKKRYSKKNTAFDKKNDVDLQNNMSREEYIL